MKHKLKIMAAVAAIGLAALATIGTNLVTPGPAEAQARAASVSGRVVDEDGRPVVGAKMTTSYHSYKSGVPYSRTARTGPDGRYVISLQGSPPGEHSVSGEYNGVSLLPENPANFASNAASVRNFRYGVAEQTADNPYGNGAIFVAENAIGDYTDLEGLEVTLVSQQTGKSYTKTVRKTGEGWTVTGLPFGSYQVSARLGGRPVRMKLHGVQHYDDPFVGGVVTASKDKFEIMRVFVQP